MTLPEGTGLVGLVWKFGSLDKKPIPNFRRRLLKPKNFICLTSCGSESCAVTLVAAIEKLPPTNCIMW